MPIEKRVVQGVLFACKTLMVDWGWSETSIWVDLETSTIFLGDEVVVQMSIADRKINVKARTRYEIYIYIYIYSRCWLAENSA